MFGGHVLALEVIAATNLPIPSILMPTGHYVSVPTSNGRRNTTMKAAMADCSISWNETFTIHAHPLMFLPCFVSIFFGKSKAIRLEIRASYESGPSELVGAFETTFAQLLVNDGLVRRPLWGRNVVIFGETGSGKSSIINAIAREQLAETSDDATGCTSGHKRHPVTISGQRFNLFDTAGLGEGPAGTVPAAEAKKQLKGLLHQLMSSRSPSDGIGLLVYCVSSRATAPPALVRAYNTFYSRVCRKKVPIVLVVTGLENEPDVESWWDANKIKFKSMHFADHACVTVLERYPDIPDDFTRRIAESSDTLRNLVVSNCSHWSVDESWSKRIAGLWCASLSWSKD
ncbi:P-loop containing nucleoside triphosphate hydrolase protein [Suillus lakei]|nr:P-loop containing nucleoside triphosphate hydrolase protein [Suillus lakei]